MGTKLKAHQKALIAIVVVAAGALLLATAVWAYDTAQKDQIAPGVTVGGVDIGGRSVEDAREVVEEEVVAPLHQAGRRQVRGRGVQAHPTRARDERRPRRDARRGGREDAGRADWSSA